jgi:putative ABC transport system permease protein
LGGRIFFISGGLVLAYIIKTALELGLLYAPIPLALFLSFRILNIADMTTDGCFVLGAVVSVTWAAAGHPVLGIFLAMAAGVLAGFVTAMLQTRFGVPSILAGIITNFGLYTVNLWVMGGSSNVNLLKTETLFTMFRRGASFAGAYSDMLLIAIITFAAAAGLIWFLSTRLGLSIRATGDNADMVRASSVNPRFTTTVGLCVSNSLTALSGGMVGQYQNTADINSGTGIVVIALACLIIGETVLGKKSMFKGAVAAILGSIIYRVIYAVVLKTRIVPMQGLKLMTAVVVAFAIAFPTIKEQLHFARKKHLASKDASGKEA